MSASGSRVAAVMGKELAEFRRNRLIVASTAFLPVIKYTNATAAAVFITKNASETLDNRDRKPALTRHAERIAKA